MAKKRKSQRDEPVSLYREGEDPAETLRALLETKVKKEAEDRERKEA